jgi:hypothetical protein
MILLRHFQENGEYAIWTNRDAYSTFHIRKSGGMTEHRKYKNLESQDMWRFSKESIKFEVAILIIILTL